MKRVRRESWPGIPRASSLLILFGRSRCDNARGCSDDSGPISRAGDAMNGASVEDGVWR
jgi:hypothetical protein